LQAARNEKELREQILKEMKKALKEVRESAVADMQEATDYFYSGGEPEMYERTYMLGDTPAATSAVVKGNEVSFEAYLNKDYQYETGSNPTMEQVLLLADQGIRFTTRGGKKAVPTVGNKRFWEKAENEIAKSLDTIMGEHFG